DMPIIHPHDFSLPRSASVGAIRFGIAGHQFEKHQGFGSPVGFTIPPAIHNLMRRYEKRLYGELFRKA
ncbi:MAG: hypothetical protein WBA17_13660, partial [Saprospiraceae bacterium]